jgi:hypothetical protein
MQAAFDVEQAAFRDIFANDFADLAPCHARYPLGILLALAVLVIPGTIDGDVEAAADRAVVGGLDIGIVAYMPNQFDVI